MRHLPSNTGWHELPPATDRGSGPKKTSSKQWHHALGQSETIPPSSPPDSGAPDSVCNSSCGEDSQLSLHSSALHELITVITLKLQTTLYRTQSDWGPSSPAIAPVHYSGIQPGCYCLRKECCSWTGVQKRLMNYSPAGLNFKWCWRDKTPSRQAWAEAAPDTTWQPDRRAWR